MLTQPQAGDSNATGPLMALSATADVLSARLRKVIGLYVVSAGAVAVTRQWWDRARSTVTFNVSVDADDVIYPALHAWVLDRVPRNRLRALVVRTARVDDGPGPTVAGRGVDPSSRVLRLFYDGRRAQTVQVGSHRVRVSVETEDLGRPQDSSSSGWSFRRDRVVFVAHGAAARDAVLEVLAELAADYNARREARLYMPRWGEWVRVDGMGLRPLDSVVLRRGQKEDLVEDLGAFLGAEKDYEVLGIPWHRGYLFTGPPGTGKTSLAKALAHRFTLDVYYLPLGSVANDQAFLNLLSSVPPRSMLLIEDVDIAHGARKRDDSDPGVSMSGLLNGLDGVTTPHGLVKVLTTNKQEVIDDALLRRGRIDRQAELGPVDDDQLGRLVSYIAGWPEGRVREVLARDHDGQVLTPADVMEVFKCHLGDRDAGVAALREMLHAAAR